MNVLSVSIVEHDFFFFFSFKKFQIQGCLLLTPDQM